MRQVGLLVVFDLLARFAASNVEIGPSGATVVHAAEHVQDASLLMRVQKAEGEFAHASAMLQGTSQWLSKFKEWEVDHSGHSSAQQPVVAAPVAGVPSTVVAAPAAAVPLAAQPAQVQPAAVQPAAVQPAAVQPAAVQPVPAQAGVVAQPAATIGVATPVAGTPVAPGEVPVERPSSTIRVIVCAALVVVVCAALFCVVKFGACFARDGDEKGLMLTGRILTAQGLRNADKVVFRIPGNSDMSDPYVVVAVDDSPVYRTQVIRNSLDPDWSETFSYEVDAKDKVALEAATVTFTVYDSDQTPKPGQLDACEEDDFLGVGTTTMSTLQRDSWQKINLLLTGQAATGRIHAELMLSEVSEWQRMMNWLEHARQETVRRLNTYNFYGYLVLSIVGVCYEVASIPAVEGDCVLKGCVGIVSGVLCLVIGLPGFVPFGLLDCMRIRSHRCASILAGLIAGGNFGADYALEITSACTTIIFCDAGVALGCVLLFIAAWCNEEGQTGFFQNMGNMIKKKNPFRKGAGKDKEKEKEKDRDGGKKERVGGTRDAAREALVGGDAEPKTKSTRSPLRRKPGD
eukprot:CAMPEP_0204380356 /NCGR_PEP_ID=MMETSP0469-20131031/53318_1 /ASSEMBLY_ACC=CAM_ASM_000384 /TAXON_ID=2969 /ORGANISM="Oxyrrhis marina" /LENGTH=571 /DNA_ID=CAMNT_0051371979 /DNA_START=30 /DNA_END=1745 /DNA_ORIENTATION=+